MTLSLSAKAKGIAPSPTLAIDSKTKALIAAGADIVNLSVGEPDFPTPVQASLAGIAAIVNNFTKYTDASGIVELRRGIAAKLRDENGLDYAPEEIIVSSGAKQSLYNIFIAILDPGDEVLLPAPYWVSYPEQIRLADGIPVIVETTEATGFKMTAGQLEQSITPKTKAVLLNSPSNPTGAMYSKGEILALAEVIERHDLFVISDEIYERLTYGQEHYSIASLSADLRARTFVVNGFSKTHAMTGWRVGYVAAPQHLVKAMAGFQSHTTANPSSISQKAALGALGTFDPDTVKQFRARRDAVLETFSRIPGLTCASPDGAFYVFPNVGAWLGQTYTGPDGAPVSVQTVDHLCELLLTDALVSTVPGTGFGAPWNLRMSYATSMEALQKGLTRMTAFLGRFS